MLCVFAGLATLDVVHHVDRLPGKDAKATSRAQFIGSGGPAANAAKTFAALGGHARLLTALGRSPVAQFVRADLEAHGVEVIDVTSDRDAPPPTSSVAVLPTGERTVIGNESVPLDTLESAEPWVAGASGLLVDGHHAPLALAAIEAAGALGVPVVVDAGRPKPVFDAIWPSVQTAICSADYRLHEGESVDEAAAGLLARGVQQVAFTQGPHPIRWWTVHDAGAISPESVDAVDTLGAGDVLHGAYCYFAQSLRRASFTCALEAAAGVATERTQHLGLAAWLTGLRDRE